MYGLKNSEVLAHHTMAIAGGCFGVYALLNRSLTFGSSETSNLIYLFVAGLTGDVRELAIRLLAFAIYVGGMMFATIMGRIFRRGDIRLLSIGIDAACCLILAQIPQNVHEVMALYPMFFATAIQWLAFTSAAGLSCSTIFSTNNCRQCFSAVANFMYTRDRKYLGIIHLYGGTLIFFHIGVIYCWVCMQIWGLKSAYACLLPVTLGFAATVRDRRLRKKEEEAATEM